MDYNSELWLDITDSIFEYLSDINIYNLCITNKAINIKNAELCKKIIELDKYGKNIDFTKINNKLVIMPINLRFLFKPYTNYSILYINKKMFVLSFLRYVKNSRMLINIQ